MISVAIPGFKVRFLRQAVESVLSQTYSNFELIIVNDASSEDIKSVVDSFEDPRIRYYENESNLGIVNNWNKCLSLAKGDYFILFSDDDIYHPSYFSTMIDLAVKYSNVDLFHCRVNIIDENGEVIDCSIGLPEYESVVDFIWHRQKRYRRQFVADFMCRTQSLRRIGGFVNYPQGWGSDDATWILIANPKGVVASSSVLCSWRESCFNVSKIGSLNERMIAINEHSKWLREFLTFEVRCTQQEMALYEQLKRASTRSDLFPKADILLFSTESSILHIFRPLFLFLRWRRLHKVQIGSLLICYVKLLLRRFSLASR